MVIQPLIGNPNPYNGYINPYYWVDDHPLLYGNNGSLDPSTHDPIHEPGSCEFVSLEAEFGSIQNSQGHQQRLPGRQQKSNPIDPSMCIYNIYIYIYIQKIPQKGMDPPSNDDDSFVCFFIPHSFFKSIDRSEKGLNRSMPWQNLSDLDFVDLRCADLAPSNRRVPGCPEGFNGGGRESRRRLLNNMGWVKHIAIGSMGLILFHYIWLQLIFFMVNV